MDRKIIMGVAAVAGIGLLLYMRKNGDQATLAGSSSLVGALGASTGWANNPIVINATTKPAQVPDTKAATPAPSPAPTAASGGASWGPAPIAPAPPAGSLNQTTGVYTYSDGSTYQNPNYGTKENPKWTPNGAIHYG